MPNRLLTLLVLLLPLWGARAEKLDIRGSNTFGEELAPRLIAEFRKDHPDLEVSLESKGTASGVLALLDGACDIAAASRPLTEDEERLARSRRVTLQRYTIGYYGVAVVVNQEFPVRGLTDRQVRDIFTGAVTNWSRVGGPDAPIRVLIRDATGGTHLGFQEVAMDRLPYAASARGFSSDALLAQALIQEPQGIGFVAMTLFKRLELKALHINGIAPSVLAVSDDLYPYARQLRLFTNRSGESEPAGAFIKFVRSSQGQNILDDMGFVRRFHRKLTFGAEVP